MQFRRRARDQPELNITPLIDVVFLLLIFFMVATSFSREAQISIDLPKASAVSKPLPDNRIEINVTSNGDYFVNGKPLVNRQLKTLMRALETFAQGDHRRLILITADRTAPHEAVVTVMDAAGKMGFHKLQISTAL
jgi:biopolymer transport protein ExbD